MSTEPLTDDIKTRVAPSMKQQLEQIADERHLSTADIVREAMREYLARNRAGQPLLPHLAEKEKVVA